MDVVLDQALAELGTLHQMLAGLRPSFAADQVPAKRRRVVPAGEAVTSTGETPEEISSSIRQSLSRRWFGAVHAAASANTDSTLTIFGRFGPGGQRRQLNNPQGLWVTPEGSVYVADTGNNRVLRISRAQLPRSTLKPPRYKVHLVAGGSDVDHSHRAETAQDGAGLGRLSAPSSVHCVQADLLDIADSVASGVTPVKPVWVYIADTGNHRVVRWLEGAPAGELVAGGHGAGSGLHQLNSPSCVFVTTQQRDATSGDTGDERHLQFTVYVSDTLNNRVVRWDNGANAGVVVASSLKQPQGLWVFPNEDVAIADTGNRRVVLWAKGAGDCAVVARGGRGGGSGLNSPVGIVAFGEDRAVLVTDKAAGRLLLYLPGSARQGISIAGNGTDRLAGVQEPVASYLDPRRGLLYVLDAAAANVRVVALVPAAKSPEEAEDESEEDEEEEEEEEEDGDGDDGAGDDDDDDDDDDFDEEEEGEEEERK